MDHFKKLNLGMENKIMELQRKVDASVSYCVCVCARASVCVVYVLFRRVCVKFAKWTLLYPPSQTVPTQTLSHHFKALALKTQDCDLKF